MSRTKKTYVLRVQLDYEGDAPKPRIHRVREWLLHCIWAGPPPINRAVSRKTLAGQNTISTNVSCWLPAGRAR